MAVELQLGLALPVSVKRSPIDLNSFDSSSDEVQSEVSICAIAKKNKKRSFDESSIESPRTLPLFLWNKQPKEEDDLPQLGKTCNLDIIRRGEEEHGIVGWPPVKAYWQKKRSRGGSISNCSFVKAQIEGTLITRKIDLRVHRGYRTISSTLLLMFGRGHQSVDEYSLTYQDNHGDWALADNVPWRTFIESVFRLKLVRKDD